jgi:hypothetical protein
MLRRQEAEVISSPNRSVECQPKSGIGTKVELTRRYWIMAYETLVAVFDSPEHAEAAEFR